MCEETTNRIPALSQQNKELIAQFESVNDNFWKTINEQRAQRRAQQVQSDQAGRDEQAE